MKNAKRKVSRRMAGGGVGVAEATDTELKVLAVIGEDATDGFGGWIDTEAMVGIPLAESPAPPTPSPEDDQAQDIETHQEVGLPVGQPMTATSGHGPVITIPTAMQSTSSFVPSSVSTPRAPKRRTAPAEGRCCLHYILRLSLSPSCWSTSTYLGL